MGRKSNEALKRERTNEIKLRYDKKALVRVNIAFHKVNDADIIEILSSKQNKSAFIKECVRKNIVKQKQ